jgi:hypothetical protein
MISMAVSANSGPLGFSNAPKSADPAEEREWPTLL